MSKVRIDETETLNQIDIVRDERKAFPPCSFTSAMNDAATDPEYQSHKRFLEHETSSLNPCNKKYISVRFDEDSLLHSMCLQFTILFDCRSILHCFYTKGHSSEFKHRETASPSDDVNSVDNQEIQKGENGVVENEKTCTEWDDICQKMMGDPDATPYRENLETFLFGMKKLVSAQASLQGTYETVHDSLQKILDSSLAAAVPIHELDCNVMSHAEMELLELFRYNHQLRKNLLESLNSHNQSWEVKYRNYISRIAECAGSQPSVVETPIDDQNGTILDTNTSKNDSDVQNVSCIEGERYALDWNEMIQLNPPSQEKIEAYLEGSERWNTACNTLSCSFDEIRQTMENHHTNILRIVESAYSRINDDMMEMQGNVQDHIVSNNQRRLQIEQSLEEIVQRQNSIFSRLMARVAGNVSCPWKRNTTE